MSEDFPEKPPGGELLLYRTEDGRTRLECRFDEGTIWLSQAQIADLFQTSPQNVSIHLKAIYAEGELAEAATCKDYLQVRQEGTRKVSRMLRHYRLEAILAVGYRVRSPRGTLFRQWATARLEEYLRKGFVMDDERLKNPPGPGVPDYFDELLERIRDIRKRWPEAGGILLCRTENLNADRFTAVIYHKNQDTPMKSYSFIANTHPWAGRIVAACLGISAITGFSAAPADNNLSHANRGDAQDQTLNWEDQFTARMQHIQQEMDDLFRDSVNDIGNADRGFFGPKFDASSTVQDRGNDYVATFNLPDRDLSDVKINVKDGVLSVKASAEQSTTANTTGKNNSGSTETEMLNQYEQLVTLPGPVDAGKMKVDKHGDSITVTIPKADEKTAASK
jgi:HSP20 family molecular chaperone IbpA